MSASYHNNLFFYNHVFVVIINFTPKGIKMIHALPAVLIYNFNLEHTRLPSKTITLVFCLIFSVYFYYVIGSSLELSIEYNSN